MTDTISSNFKVFFVINESDVDLKQVSKNITRNFLAGENRQSVCLLFGYNGTGAVPSLA
jgi:hypothetical protein